MKEYSCVKITSFNEPDDLHELEAVSALPQNVNRVLADPVVKNHRVRDQVGFAHDGFCKEDTQDSLCFLSSLTAPEAHDQLIFQT